MRIKNSVAHQGREIQFRKVISPRSLLFLCLACHHFKGLAPLPHVHTQGNCRPISCLGLTLMPFASSFPEVKAPVMYSHRNIFQLLMSFTTKKKKNDSEWMEYNSEYFSSLEFFINNRCCRVMHAATLNISLIWFSF